MHKSGELPNKIGISKPRTAFDEIAIELFATTLSDTPGAPVVVVNEHGRQ